MNTTDVLYDNVESKQLALFVECSNCGCQHSPAKSIKQTLFRETGHTNSTYLFCGQTCQHAFFMKHLLTQKCDCRKDTSMILMFNK